MEKIFAVDFGGTLIKPEVIERANIIRYKLLGIPLPTEEDHKKLHATKGHYSIIKEHIGKMFGIDSHMKIAYVNNYGNQIELSGKSVKTMIMTDLFRNAMYFVANELKKDIFTEDMIDSLCYIKDLGYKLAVFSGIRTDIISGMLEISNQELKFDYILGQDPVLSRDNNLDQLRSLSQNSSIAYILGDKLTDLEPAKSLNAKSIFLRGGHSLGGEEVIANYVIDSPKELYKFIK
jgi:phosphoglycolate phosphatase-like HAD superfamily hydrolase